MQQIPPEQHWTRVFIVVVLVLIFAWEMIMLWLFGPDGTISWTVYDLSLRYKFLPFLVVFAMGLLVGHIWWPL